MSRETYVTKRFNGKSVELISTANGIIEEYQEQGYDLTLRQLYYQFVARDLIENTQRAYKRLGAVVSDARLAGLIDWSAITDRTRTLRGNSHWSSPEGVIDSAYYGYREDKWSSQPTRVEAWIEKDALLGVISRVCTRLDIDYFSCRGYPSQSAIYTAAQRFKDYNEEGQKVVVLHLGDHDPSGLDMTRDINDRLNLFEVPDFEVRRIALTPEQVSLYNPPPNPAKVTDSRAADYIAVHGNQSWELDALEPDVLSDLIRSHTEGLREDDEWSDAVDAEQANKQLLRAISRNWGEVAEHLRDTYEVGS